METIARIKILGEVVAIKSLERLLRQNKSIKLLDKSEPIPNKGDSGFHQFLTVKFEVEDV